ncbi:D-erythronate 2-dehydrogenase [Paramixta manurensis]|uniref:D-erythronate 2-dehydrogenase n=1 Tax=Paramixta manurensis TaxID=2740817 RepID=A0A6M8U4J3_9GAMM|nr:D-erythronate 2-dehydrogenase [Erwiniaceae bacterium PD-1]
MKVLVTGAAGFLGKKLIQALLTRGQLTDSAGQRHDIQRIVACDRIALSDIQDPRLTVRSGDISDAAFLATLFEEEFDSVFHLAAVVSGQAEQEFELGMTINFDATRQMMEALRQQQRRAKMVITSSVAVFGGSLPAQVPDEQVWRPQSSYGVQKAMNDLLLSDYSRRGWIDGRSLRMPTIVVRPGKPNQAASSFASGIIREPLNGEAARCPVALDTRLWLLSPARAIAALVQGHELNAGALDQGRVINMTGLSVTVEQMIAALRRVAGDGVVEQITFQHDPQVEKIVNSWPGDFHATYAKRLGFSANADFDEIVQEYIAEANIRLPLA